MKSWESVCKAVNVTYQQTLLVDETAKIVGVSWWEVLEVLGFSDEWILTFDDNYKFLQVPEEVALKSASTNSQST